VSGRDPIEREAADPDADRKPTRHERLFGPWDNSYQDGLPPWDLGRPQPAIVRLADQEAFAGKVLDAGCGSGEHALFLAARGYEVVGVDVAATAIGQARQKAARRHLVARFLVADALHLERLEQTFESILDVGLFHTFDDEDRRAYVASLASVTVAGTVLHLLCFSDATPGDWGPRRVSQAELRSAYGMGWNVVSIAAERIETRFDKDGVPAWLARIERA
jgi:SAM-dependent methyltransferase